MLERLIIFIIRSKYGVRRGQCFRFENQKEDVVYFFGKDRLWKMRPCGFDVEAIKYDGSPCFTESNVSLNWLLNDKCAIRKVDLPWLT